MRTDMIETDATRRRHQWAVLLLWVTPAMWSTNYLVARWGSGLIAPHQLALGRWSVALALMLPFAWQALSAQPRTWWREWPQLLVLGALGMWVCGAFVYIGGHTTTALNIGLIYAAAPVGIALLSVKVLGERVGGLQALAGAMALCGVLHVVLKGQWTNLQNLRLTPGDVWIAVAAACWVGYAVLQMHWKSVLAPHVRLVAVAAGGVAVLLPATLIERALVPTPPFDARGIGLVLLAGVVPGALSYSAHAFVQRELGAARTSLMLYVAPLWAALLGWALLGEQPRWHHAVGAALILPAIALAGRKK
jgi:drug/metabolite transporter (DMT)-like permease